MPPASTIGGDLPLAEAQRLREAVDRERREGVGLRVAGAAHRVRGVEQRLRRSRTPPSGRRTAWPGRRRAPSVRPSFRRRLDLRLRQQRPHLKDRDQRQHPDEQEHQRQRRGRSCRTASGSPRPSGSTSPTTTGTKSRWRLVTMMTNRSSHMPTLTNIATVKSADEVAAQPLRPQDLRHDEVAERAAPSRSRRRGRSRCGSSA